MKKVLLICILLFLILSPVLSKNFGGIGIQSGLNGWSSDGMPNYASISFRSGKIPMIFTLGGGGLRKGYNGFSIKGVTDYIFKTIPFPNEKSMEVYFAAGLSCSYGHSKYYNNLEGSCNIITFDPRILAGYSYYLFDKFLEIYATAALELGLYYENIDGRYISGKTTYGERKNNFNINWDIPLAMGLRFWF